MSSDTSQSTHPPTPRAVRWIDTHFHVDRKQPVAADIQEAVAAGVSPLIAVAASLPDSKRLAALVDAFPQLYGTVGIHPHAAAKHTGDMEVFRELCRQPKICAIGEIGLDYYYEHSDRDIQKEVFTAFLRLANDVGLPAVIHCRDAYDDCLGILDDTLEPDQPFEIHSYTGSPEWAEKVTELGGYFSFNGIVTFKRADNVRESLRAIPIDRLLLETDSPYLAPVPYRGKRNHPAYIPYIAQVVAREKGVSLEEIARATTANAERFFGLS